MAKFIAKTDCGQTTVYAETLAEAAIQLENSGVKAYYITSFPILDPETAVVNVRQECKNTFDDSFDNHMKEQAADGDSFAIEYFENR